MLGIGEFAGLTGLSVKALRHYDEKAVLVPAEVDDLSGYRRYAEGQVRSGVVARALRDAGVPLPAVASVVIDGGASDALAEHRRLVREERMREDRAFDAAEEVLRALAVPVEVVERERRAQPFVGAVVSIGVDDDDPLSNDDANTLFGELFEQLQASNLGPSGKFWTTLREGERGTVELVCCWPTSIKVDDAWCGPRQIADVLPARTELVARWQPTQGETLPEGATHPAIVALFDAISERHIELRSASIRQSMTGQHEDDMVVEVAVTVETR